LARIALGQIEPSEGSVRLGANVRVGYFAQDASDLDPKRTPVSVLNGEFGLTEDRARDYLGRFLLSGDDAIRPIGSLSGGERNKLALARLILREPNLLVLDEPTNHLDIDSREALADILSEYKGTLVLISHDRWLLNAVTDHTLDIRRNGATQYPGSYAAYRRSQTPEPKREAKQSAQTSREQTGMTPRELSREIERISKLVSTAEAGVTARESDLREIELLMSNPSQVEDLHGMSVRYAECQSELEKATQEWFQLSLKLEELHELRGTSSRA
jgi:ATP-binding cassette subfamily F protein 3